MNQKIDIIIVNYNSTDYALKCIKSIHKSRESIEPRVIVVDNCSKDSPERLKRAFPDIDLVINNQNLGFAKAVNIGVEKAVGELVMLLNPDAYIYDGFFKKIIDYISCHENVAIVAPKILESDGSIQGSARRFPTPLTSIFGRKSPLTKLFPENSITKKEFYCFNNSDNKPIEVDWVSGACMVTRTRAFKEIGGFDERFFLYWEDADLCKRLRDFGWKIIYYPKVKICHHTGTSSNTVPIFSIYQFHKSCFQLYMKHTRWPRQVIMPITLAGLSLRCLLIIGLNTVQRLVGKSISSITIQKNNKLNNSNSSKKVKVLRIVSRLNIGGPSIHCSILMNGFNNERYESKLISGSISKHEGDMSYIIDERNELFIRIPELQREIDLRKDFLAFIRIIRLIFKEKPDIVHTHQAKAGTVSRIAVWIYNAVNRKSTKTVHTFHGHVLEGYFSSWKSKIFIQIEKALARITDAIIAISQTQKWELTEKYQLTNTDKVHVINLGFDLSRFINVERKGELKDRIGAQEGTFLIGIVGRLVPIKNHRVFLKAAAIVKKRYPMKLLKFIIVGDGELRNDLEQYAKQLGIDEHVIFYGWVKSIQKVYSDLDLLVLTSNNEGTPVSIIESMAASVPVVTTGVGGIKDLLGRIEGRTDNNAICSICERGILCPKGNAKAIADGIAYAMEHNDPIRIRRARDFVLKKYSDSCLIRKVDHLYRNLLDGC